MFLDYNQNAKDRTTCSAYSVRPLPDARVSTPLHWHEVPDCEPADFTVLTIPKRFAEIGDPHAGVDGTPGSLEKLLELAAKDEAAGLGDAPWPPHFRKMTGEAPRVTPSRSASTLCISCSKPGGIEAGGGRYPFCGSALVTVTAGKATIRSITPIAPAIESAVSILRFMANSTLSFPSP